LIRVTTQTKPDEMNVVWHQTIDGTKNPLTGGGMKHQLPEFEMKGIVQPAGFAIENRQSPVNCRVALIEFWGQSRKIESSRFAVHGLFISETPDVVSYRFFGVGVEVTRL
jgi:hypothetical protein